MKFLCVCGHVIADQTDYLAYKGYFYPDKNSDDAFRYSDQLKAYFSAAADGKRGNWIRKHLGDYALKFSEPELISEIVFMSLVPTQTLYQCESCSRLWVYRKKSARFVSFLPEDPLCKGLFEGSDEDDPF